MQGSAPTVSVAEMLHKDEPLDDYEDEDDEDAFAFSWRAGLSVADR